MTKIYEEKVTEQVNKIKSFQNEYYDAMKSQFRQVGNRLTETGKSSIITASLLA